MRQLILVTVILFGRYAAAVMGSYQFDLSKPVIVVTVLFCAAMVIICFCVPDKRTYTWKRIKTRLGLLMCVVAISAAGYWSIDPDALVWASWRETVTLNGFLVETVNDLYFRLNPLRQPEGYNIDNIEVPKADRIDTNEQCPDIIVILNETFSELDYSVIIDTDVDYLENFRNIDGAVYGNAAAVKVGGGTNDSEFELLTSKSEYLLRSASPFTFLSDYQLERSVA